MMTDVVSKLSAREIVERVGRTLEMSRYEVRKPGDLDYFDVAKKYGYALSTTQKAFWKFIKMNKGDLDFDFLHVYDEKQDKLVWVIRPR